MRPRAKLLLVGVWLLVKLAGVAALVLSPGCSGGPAYLVHGTDKPGTGARLEVVAGPLSSDLKVEQIATLLRVPKDALTPELVAAFMKGIVPGPPEPEVVP